MTSQRPATDLFTPPVLAVVQALLPAQTRAVGGAVRALLTGQPMAHVDIDLATTATPEEMLARFKQLKMPLNEGGLRWGSLTVGEERPVDVTTLRQDKYLPGSRYPTVGWTTDWHTDSLRRDFTINAIYLSPDGSLFDPHNGQADLEAGVVRFIGDPATRLAEDPLRLLRFFRFCGTYGLAGFTPELEPVLAAAVPALKSLSRARVAEELSRLDLTPHAVSVKKAMAQVGLQTA
jgi:poly(A) polymerase